MSNTSRQRWAWPVLLLVLAVSLTVGMWPKGNDDRSNVARAQHLAQQVRCPTCSGLSAAESDSLLAQSTRDEIARRVAVGQTDQQIRDFFVSRYGSDALMSPERTGVIAAAWVTPLAGAVVAIGGVAFAVRRWRVNADDVHAQGGSTDGDRVLVEAALRNRK